MNYEADRIKLAEAMGWRQSAVGNWYKKHDLREDMRETFQLPDPFTDANDDYACLQFLQEKRKKEGKPYKRIGESYFYQVGDWARSLQKELDSEDN